MLSVPGAAACLGAAAAAAPGTESMSVLQRSFGAPGGLLTHRVSLQLQ